VSLDTNETLLKYIGGMHSYLRHTLLMFNPSNLDDVCVQATHMEARGKHTNDTFVKKTTKFEANRKVKTRGKRRWQLLRKMVRSLHVLIVRRDMMSLDAGSFILS
jgi:hypothetical protein